MKPDHRMGRCFLKGLLGAAIHAVLAAAGRNFRKLLRCVFALIFGLVRAAKGWKRPSQRVHWLFTTA